MSDFERARAALAAEAPTLADLEAALQETRSLKAAAEARVAEARAEEDGSVARPRDERVQRRAELAAATAELADAERIEAALVRRFEAERAGAEARAREEAYEKAAAGAHEAGRLMKRYEKAAREVRAVLRQMTVLNVAVEAANAALPHGASALPAPEIAARAIPALPREEVRAGDVDLWCRRGSLEPLPATLQAEVQRSADGSGFLPMSGGGAHKGGTSEHLVRRRFRRTEYLVAVPARRPAESLLEAVHLPGVGPDDPPLWSPDLHFSAASLTLEMIDAQDQASPPLQRSREVRVDLVCLDEAEDVEDAVIEAAAPPPQGQPLQVGIWLDQG